MGLANWKAEGILSGYQEIICSWPYQSPISGTIFPYLWFGRTSSYPLCSLSHPDQQQRRWCSYPPSAVEALLTFWPTCFLANGSNPVASNSHDVLTNSHISFQSLYLSAITFTCSQENSIWKSHNCFIPAFNSHQFSFPISPNIFLPVFSSLLAIQPPTWQSFLTRPQILKTWINWIIYYIK